MLILTAKFLADISWIDDPYTLEQLQSPRMNVSIVRPLVDRLYENQDVSVGMESSYNKDTPLNAKKLTSGTSVLSTC